jgi:hypothetical protein
MELMGPGIGTHHGIRQVRVVDPSLGVAYAAKVVLVSLV